MMLQRRLAAKILGCSPRKIRIEPANLDEAKEAITRFDIRRLMNKGVISKAPPQHHGRFWAREHQAQRRKSRKKGQGSRKGASTARTNPKKRWMATIRLQRDLLHRLKAKNYLTHEKYRELYGKCKGGYFRSLRHLKLTIGDKS